MKVLSFQQPWASLIAAGIKDVENRTWEPKELPKRILIHASKKCSLRSMYDSPIEWVQEILNEQQMGNLPDFQDMPSNSIIGYFSVDRIDKKTDDSIWASGGDDHEKLLYWHLKDCYLFDEPITDVKGKLWLWDYDLDEDKLPSAHQVKLVGYEAKGEDVIIPVKEEIWKKLDENQDCRFDLGVLASLELCTENLESLKPFKSIIFEYKGQQRKFHLTEETEQQQQIDSKGEPCIYLSLLNPEGSERWMAYFKWDKEIK